MFALIVANSQYYPGLMFALDSNGQPKRVCKGGEADPLGGGCGDIVPHLQAVAFYTPNDGESAATSIHGVTLCPIWFTLPTIDSLGDAVEDGGTDEMFKFLQSGGPMYVFRSLWFPVRAVSES